MRWLLLSISLDLRNLYLDGMDEHSGRVKLIESGIYESDLEVSWWFLYATVDNFIIKCYNESVTFKISAIFYQNNIF